MGVGVVGIGFGALWLHVDVAVVMSVLLCGGIGTVGMWVHGFGRDCW